MAVGYTLERVAYRPLRRAPRLAPLITAIGLSIILQHLALIIWSRNPLPFPQIVAVVPYPHDRRADGATITNVQIAIIVHVGGDDGAACCCSSIARKLGVAMRATVAEPAGRGPDGHRHQPRDLAHLRHRRGARRGRRRDGRHATTASRTTRWASCSGLKAFSAAVLGGIGNLAGAMLGGLLLGVIEALGAGYVGDLTNLCQLVGLVRRAIAERCVDDPNLTLFGSNYQDVFAFLVLIAVLIFRPSGLLGERVSDRA